MTVLFATQKIASPVVFLVYYCGGGQIKIFNNHAKCHG